jgi:hypothetical protein
MVVSLWFSTLYLYVIHVILSSASVPNQFMFLDKLYLTMHTNYEACHYAVSSILCFPSAAEIEDISFSASFL